MTLIPCHLAYVHARITWEMCDSLRASSPVLGQQVVNYALTRPAREVLFTVVSREEKYRAKLVIDTAVQRFGDALAAAMFQYLQVTLTQLLHRTLNHRNSVFAALLRPATSMSQRSICSHQHSSAAIQGWAGSAMVQ